MNSTCFFLVYERPELVSKRGCIGHNSDMPHRCPIISFITRKSYGTHLLDHLAAHGTSLLAGQIAVVALLQVDADLP